MAQGRVRTTHGAVTADVVLIIALATPVAILGLIVGIDPATGPLGVVAFVLMAGLWGLAFTGFPYSIALRTGNPTAVNNAFLLFFPFAFLTTAYPASKHDRLAGDRNTVQPDNLPAGRDALSAARGLALGPDRSGPAGYRGVGTVSFSLAFAALRGRVKRN